MQVIKKELNDYGVPMIRAEDGEFAVEFELVPIFKTSDPRSDDVVEWLKNIEQQLKENEKDIQTVKSQIEANTSQADRIDLTVAAGCGVLAGLYDVFFVGEFDFKGAKAWSNKKTNKFIMKMAEQAGHKSDGRLESAIRYLENHYTIASDAAVATGGNRTTHHLDDFAHHPSIIGLIFSLLTQFTELAYFSNKNGVFSTKPANPDRIGKDFQSKILKGTVDWFYHLVSDMDGTSGKTAGKGMGIPGPIMSLAKEISAIPGINQLGLAKIIDDMYEGNYFKYSNGRKIKIDFRSELAVAHELGRQAIPVIVNEIMVRTFYFIRRLYGEWLLKQNISDINWEKVLPFKNATITRMITVASGAFAAVDIGDAAVRSIVSGTGWTGFLLRINFVNLFRFSLSMKDEACYAMKREQLGCQMDKLTFQRIALLNVKIAYQGYGLWLVAKDVVLQIESTEQLFLNYAEQYRKYSQNINNNLDYARARLGNVRREDSKSLQDKIALLKNRLNNK